MTFVQIKSINFMQQEINVGINTITADLSYKMKQYAFVK